MTIRAFWLHMHDWPELCEENQYDFQDVARKRSWEGDQMRASFDDLQDVDSADNLLAENAVVWVCTVVCLPFPVFVGCPCLETRVMGGTKRDSAYERNARNFVRRASELMEAQDHPRGAWLWPHYDELPQYQFRFFRSAL